MPEPSFNGIKISCAGPYSIIAFTLHAIVACDIDS